MKYLCIFCGSSIGLNPAYQKAAKALALQMVSRNIGMIYGGTHIGMMGIIADAMLDASGKVIGIIPQPIFEKQLAHPNLNNLKVVDTLHESKKLMSEMADGFIALPGGFGTLDELFEILTQLQLGLHNKPCAILNTEGFFDPLIKFLDHAVDEKFVASYHRSLLLTSENPENLLAKILDHH